LQEGDSITIDADCLLLQPELGRLRYSALRRGRLVAALRRAPLAAAAQFARLVSSAKSVGRSTDQPYDGA